MLLPFQCQFPAYKTCQVVLVLKVVSLAVSIGSYYKCHNLCKERIGLQGPGVAGSMAYKID